MVLVYLIASAVTFSILLCMARQDTWTDSLFKFILLVLTISAFISIERYGNLVDAMGAKVDQAVEQLDQDEKK